MAPLATQRKARWKRGDRGGGGGGGGVAMALELAEGAALAVGRLALKLVVRVILLVRTVRATLIRAVSKSKGSRPQKLSRVALVVGEALEREGGSLTSSWDDLFLSLGYAIRWFDCRGVESVILYDLQGVLKSQWGTKELKRALEKGEGGGEGKTACTIKILSKEDWENAVTQFVSEKSAGGMRLGKWIETFAVTKLENGCSGVGVTPLGDAPQLILVFSEDNLFSLCGFFPWLTKSAEIYKISKGTLENDLCVALKNFYNTKMRFGS